MPALTFPSRSYIGVGIPTYITGFTLGTSGTSGTFTLNNTGSWYDVTTGAVPAITSKFVITVDIGLSTEEKMLVTMNGTNITVIARNYDGATSTGYDHSASIGNTSNLVAPAFSAIEAAEANRAAVSLAYMNTSGAVDPTPPGAIVVAGSPSTSTNGSATTAARVDHYHNIPGSLIVGALGTVLSTTVTASRVWSISNAAISFVITGYNNYLIISSSYSANSAVATQTFTTKVSASSSMTSPTTLTTGGTYAASATAFYSASSIAAYNPGASAQFYVQLTLTNMSSPGVNTLVIGFN